MENLRIESFLKNIAKSNTLGHLMQITDSFEKILMVGKIEVGRIRGR